MILSPIDVILGIDMGFFTMLLAGMLEQYINGGWFMTMARHDDSIGRKCAAFRRMLGITQEQVARDVGCSRSNISAFERGRTDSATIFLWYIKAGLFHWKPADRW